MHFGSWGSNGSQSPCTGHCSLVGSVFPQEGARPLEVPGRGRKVGFFPFQESKLSHFGAVLSPEGKLKDTGKNSGC